MYYIDNNGIEHESYAAACHYYGADSPEQIAAEAEAALREGREEMMDLMMAGVVQPAGAFTYWPPAGGSKPLQLDDDIPF